MGKTSPFTRLDLCLTSLCRCPRTLDYPGTRRIHPPTSLFQEPANRGDSQARPVKLETLAQKRLAVDASIWIYQVRFPSSKLTSLVPESCTRQRRPGSPQFSHRRVLPPNL